MRTILIPRRSNPQERKSVFFKPSGMKVGVGVGNTVRVIGGVGMRTVNVTRSVQPRESAAGVSVVREGVRPLRLGGAAKAAIEPATVETAAEQSLAEREELPKADEVQKPLEQPTVAEGGMEVGNESAGLDEDAESAEAGSESPSIGGESQVLESARSEETDGKGKRRRNRKRKNRY